MPHGGIRVSYNATGQTEDIDPDDVSDRITVDSSNDLEPWRAWQTQLNQGADRPANSAAQVRFRFLPEYAT